MRLDGSAAAVALLCAGLAGGGYQLPPMASNDVRHTGKIRRHPCPTQEEKRAARAANRAKTKRQKDARRKGR